MIPSTTSKNSPEVLKEIKEKGTSMVYVCKLQPRPGALNLSKCVEMGIPPGPMLGKIKNGEDVELANGTVVSAKDVCEPDDPGPLFIGIMFSEILLLYCYYYYFCYSCGLPKCTLY